MGWNSWNTFATNIDEKLVRETADEFIRLGLKDAGYGYLVLDDGWMAMERDAAGNLIADPKTRLIGLYLESVTDGQRLMELARTTEKPIVASAPGPDSSLTLPVVTVNLRFTGLAWIRVTVDDQVVFEGLVILAFPIIPQSTGRGASMSRQPESQAKDGYENSGQGSRGLRLRRHSTKRIVCAEPGKPGWSRLSMKR